MIDQDISAELAERVRQAYNQDQPVSITGSGSKSFLGREPGPESIRLDLTPHCGILNYEPAELVLTARAGTPLAEIERVLAAQGQMLPFEPPQFQGQVDGTGTLGGAVAAGLSGPARPWQGAVRDAVLGVRLINGQGQILKFGGQVMKNVAGYDVSRLMVGAFGTLGVLLDISVRVVPMPRAQQSQIVTVSAEEALARFAE
ncbi:glycolate oxidase subunit GlcE [Halothiobacillus sp.]|uniref:glycolate oxidase subunit GlcE n=1 Tax=Halothiobacillus sp. TaxID=1891311 RepID=UPI00345C2734